MIWSQSETMIEEAMNKKEKNLIIIIGIVVVIILWKKSMAKTITLAPSVPPYNLQPPFTLPKGNDYQIVINGPLIQQ